MVVADFLLSPTAQGRKADPDVWGDPTVLDLGKLTEDQRNLFPTSAPEIGKSVLEPHASWVEVLEAGWTQRYAQ